MSDPPDPALPLWTRLLIEAGRLSPGTRLLDVGGGSGRLSAALHAASGAACTVADPQPAPAPLPGVTFVAAPADALPFLGGTFGAVLFSHVLHHLSSPETALREAARVAAPGARLLIRTASHADLRALPHARWMPRLLGGICASVPDTLQIQEWLERAGWTDVELTPVRTPQGGSMEDYGEAVAALAFREWALAPGGGPDPRVAARAWAVAAFEAPPPVPETLITARR